jgi:hypothetical protein
MTEPNPEPTAPAEGTDPAATPNRAAAKYRLQLRKVEAERDQLAEIINRYRSAEVIEAAETAGMASGQDLLDVGTKLEDLLTEDGDVDPGKVAAAVDAVLTERPHWRKVTPGLDLGARPGVTEHSKTWADVIRTR